MSPRLVLLTDYGHADELVGVVHLVLARHAPDATVVDLTHDIAAHDVRAGALALWRSLPWLAPGVVLAVVDPGVGTARRAVALETGTAGLWMVGPDNGLLLPAALAAGGVRRAVALPAPHERPDGRPAADPGAEPAADPTADPGAEPAAMGPAAIGGGGLGVTDAGRDLFAPAAAALARGVDLGRLGPPIDPSSLVGRAVDDPVTTSEGLTCEVLWVDRFANAELNARPGDVAHLGPDLAVTLPGRESAKGRTWSLVRAATYGDVPPGVWGLVTDSYGLCAISGDRRSAAEALGLRPGDPVLIGSRPTWY